MNTTTVSVAPAAVAVKPVNYVTRLLDNEWIVAIEEEIARQPEHISEVIEPELMGRYDAEMGYVCEPLRYYIRLGDIEAYIIGWKEASAVLDGLRADTDDYESDMLDREYHAHGGW